MIKAEDSTFMNAPDGNTVNVLDSVRVGPSALETKRICVSTLTAGHVWTAVASEDGKQKAYWSGQ